jgi:hypothetical protein
VNATANIVCNEYSLNVFPTVLQIRQFDTSFVSNCVWNLNPRGANVVNGPYYLSSLTLLDNSNSTNGLYLTAQNLTDRGYNPLFTVISIPDTTPPYLYIIDIYPTTFNLTENNETQSINVTFSASDDVSGLFYVNLYATNAYGLISIPYYWNYYPLNGTGSIELTFYPQMLHPGYIQLYAQILDKQQNSRFQGIPIYIDVIPSN